MKKIDKGFILPSAAFTIRSSQIKYYIVSDKKPKMGDIVYGQICLIGQHSSLENASGRIHMIHDGTKAVFVFGNRYAEYIPSVPVIFIYSVLVFRNSATSGVMLLGLIIESGVISHMFLSELSFKILYS